MRVFTALRSLGASLANALIPPLCPGCEGVWSDFLCSSCAHTLERLRLPHQVCRTCGMPMESRRCFRCRQFGKPFAFERARSSFYYTGLVKTLIHRGKYEGYPAFLEKLAHLTLLDWPVDVDAVVPVPGNPVRSRERGYEPVRILARFVAQSLEIPLLNVLTARKGLAQAEQKTYADRIRNVSGRFKLKGNVPLPERVLLVDDVITTGATAHEASRVLRAGGARKIQVWTLASEIPEHLLPSGIQDVRDPRHP